MSRLDSAIRRLEAQRACLGRAAALIESLPGPVLELGLGNGRTYDHLRGLLPGREIFVFDRQVAAHPDCIPDDEHMILGGFAETVPGAAARIGAPAALVHADIGSGDKAATAALAANLAPALAALVAPGGVLVSDQPMAGPGWAALDPPDGVASERYFIYLRTTNEGGLS
ncbi:MAG: class I SAM-dependent methyltransferase [Alphaproteobacteria bacterium]